MNQSFNKNRFDIIIKGVHYFLRFAVGATAVLGILLFVGAIAVAFVPKELLDFNLANIENININVMNVLYSINDNVLTGVVNVKGLIVFGLLTGVVNLVFLFYFLRQMKKVIIDVREEQPFSQNNVTALKYLGIAFLVSSVVLPILNQSFMMYVVNLVNLFQANVNFSIDLQSLFIGLLILILASIFEYGKYLQEDHDMTV